MTLDKLEILKTSWEKLKTKGNELYLQKKIELSLRYYKIALNFNENPMHYLNCSAAFWK